MKVAKFEKISKKQFENDLLTLLDTKGNNYNDIILPYRATKYSAGYDFTSPVTVTLDPGTMVRIPTGIRCYIENDYVLSIFPRSSLGFKYQIGLANTVGIIDADYYYAKNEGHIIVALVNRGKETVTISKGDRFAQGVFLQYHTAEEQDVLAERVGGFGSSNK